MENEIKVGEWVRTTGGHIRKVSKIMPCYENDLLLSDTYYIEFDEKGDIGTYKSKQAKEFITKHSPNIIDLIEVNDYVNERKVQQVFIDPFTKKKRLLIEGTKENWQGDMSSIYCEADEIKSVVTHEQFKSIEYTINEREEKENG